MSDELVKRANGVGDGNAPHTPMPNAEACPQLVGSASAGDVTTPGDVAALLDQIRVQARGDLYFFIKGVLGYDKLTPHVHMPLCRLLELYDGYTERLVHPWSVYRAVLCDVFRRMGLPRAEWPGRLHKIKRRGLKRMCILLPRTWYKTTIVSIGYPLWRAIADPTVVCLLAQNTFKNATAKGSALAQLVMGNQLFRALYPELLPTSDERWSEDKRCLRRTSARAEATFEYAGAGTQVTSRHYKLIIEDDTVAPGKDDLGVEALLPSSDDVAKAIGWHRLVSPLLDDILEDQILVVGTRWFELDLLRWVMDSEPGYLVYERGVREDADGRPHAGGVITYPERFNDEVLTALEASMGPYLYSCLYLNRPVGAGQMTFKPEWMQIYDTEPKGLVTFTTVDLATDPKECKGVPDYNVVLTCGKDMVTGRIYVLGYDREHCDVGRTTELIFQHYRRWHPVTVGIEKVAWQSVMLYYVREVMRKNDLWFNVEGIQCPRRGNAAYIMGLQPVFSSRSIFLREHMDALRNELLVYPLGKNDDVAAALGMQVGLWRTTRAAEEIAQEQSWDVNSYDTVMALARMSYARESGAHDGTDMLRRRPPAAWGASMPKIVFDGGRGGGGEIPGEWLVTNMNAEMGLRGD